MSASDVALLFKFYDRMSPLGKASRYRADNKSMPESF